MLHKRLLNNGIIVLFSIINLLASIITIVTLGCLWVQPVPADTVKMFCVKVGDEKRENQDE